MTSPSFKVARPARRRHLRHSSFERLKTAGGGATVYRSDGLVSGLDLVGERLATEGSTRQGAPFPSGDLWFSNDGQPWGFEAGTAVTVTTTSFLSGPLQLETTYYVRVDPAQQNRLQFFNTREDAIANTNVIDIVSNGVGNQFVVAPGVSLAPADAFELLREIGYLRLSGITDPADLP